jgi:hypothetical protein
MPYIAIDTNIFEHLLNPDVNSDLHIDKLLGYLSMERYKLLVDSTRKIGNEYQRMIIPIILNTDDTGQKLQLLRYWMIHAVRYHVELIQSDTLMQHIRRIICEIAEHTDRAFVYVVCKMDSMLVTNDHTHIVGRRSELLKKTKRERGPNTDIKRSNDACIKFFGRGESV